MRQDESDEVDPDRRPVASLVDQWFASNLDAAKGGDQRAFERIFKRFSGRTLAYARMRDAHDPEGVVNEAFLKVFRNLDSFEGGESQFRAWIFTITRHRIIDEARGRSRRVEERPLTARLDAEAGNVEGEAMSRLGNEWVYRQLDLLTAEQRDVILLRIISDLTVDAVAEVMGKRSASIKALQRRALRALARQLQREGAPL